MSKLTDAQLKEYDLQAETLPQHVAIIMDGNGRWAKRRALPRAMGHRAGVNRLHEITRFSSDAGIRVLTVYAFSTENWKRPLDEVNTLMKLLIEYLNKEVDELHANQVRICTLGDIAGLPIEVQKTIEHAAKRTAGNNGLTLNVALNYGSQAEILHAVNACVSASKVPVTQEEFAAQLYTADLPPLDLLIRTGGEKRLSNFLLYQAAYAELIFLDDFWPDFSQERYVSALREFASRKRRYGGLGGSE